MGALEGALADARRTLMALSKETGVLLIPGRGALDDSAPRDLPQSVEYATMYFNGHRDAQSDSRSLPAAAQRVLRDSAAHRPPKRTFVVLHCATRPLAQPKRAASSAPSRSVAAQRTGYHTKQLVGAHICKGT